MLGKRSRYSDSWDDMEEGEYASAGVFSVEHPAWELIIEVVEYLFCWTVGVMDECVGSYSDVILRVDSTC